MVDDIGPQGDDVPGGEPYPPIIARIRHATYESPVDVAGPTFKISRTEAIDNTAIGGGPTNAEGNSALLVESKGLPANQQQVTAITGVAINYSVAAFSEGPPIVV